MLSPDSVYGCVKLNLWALCGKVQGSVREREKQGGDMTASGFRFFL